MAQIGSLETTVIEHGTGPTIIMVHGITNSLDVWHPLMDKLGTKYHCVAYNQRGHGGARTTDGDYSLEAFGTDLENIVDTYAPDGCFALIGHSFGCVTIQSLLHQRPDIAEKVFLFHSTAKSPGFMSPSSKLDDTRQHMINSVNQQMLLNLIDPASLQMPQMGVELPMWRNQSITSMFATDQDAWPQILESVNNFDYREQNKEIRHPNLWTVGASHDELVTRDEIVELATSLQSNLSWLIPATHMSMFGSQMPMFLEQYL